LHRANLFVISLDDEGQWFRYHHLFADLLKARLRQNSPPASIAALHLRAAGWYEQAGMVPEAIEHALAAADFPYVVRLVEKIALPVILQARVRTVEGWLQAVPREYIESSPRILMAFAWLNLLRGAFAEAFPTVERLAAMFDSPQAGDLDPSLQGEWLALQSEVLNRQGKPAESRDLANQALQILPASDAPVRTMALVNLATAYQIMLDYDHAAETYQWIVRDAQARNDHVLETLGTSGRAQMVLQQGRLHLAFEIASEGVKRVEASGKSIPFSATLYGELGQIYYQWHQPEQARRYLLRSIQSSGQSGYSDPEIYHHLVQSRMFQMNGDWENAAREQQLADELALKIPPAMIRENIISQRVRVDLAFDRLAAAQASLQADGFRFENGFAFPEISPGTSVTHPAGLLYNSALRILLYQARKNIQPEDLPHGFELAAQALAGELLCRHIPVALETLLLRAQLYAVLGDEQNSFADVLQALELAEPEGFISPFVEEGRPIAEILRALLERRSFRTVQPAYVQEILAAFPASLIHRAERREPASSNPPPASQLVSLDESLAPVEALTNRELEILKLIAAGDSNQAIAEKLFITVSAVKK
ncbi:MAG TPA: LuxR C-terminal-related transcriptional regulator, partial [Anaerolineales bacterium]